MDTQNSNPVFTDEEENLLAKVQGFLADSLDEISSGDTKLTDDEDRMHLALVISKNLTDGIHKKVNARNKNKELEIAGDTAESNMEFLKSVREELGKGNKIPTGPVDLPDDLIPELVPGQIEVGIHKPTLKEIMDTEIVDEDDEEDE